MSDRPAALQVVILRDGLLVGTEVLVPGAYVLGSGPGSDVRLDDPAVGDPHATLYFQNGRAAIQDGGSFTGVLVNGHKVKTCEVRSQDEVMCGPFVLKIRPLVKAVQEKAAPPPEVAALLGGEAPPPPPRRPSSPPARNVSRMPALGEEKPTTHDRPVSNPKDNSATVLSARKRAELVIDNAPTASIEMNPALIAAITPGSGSASAPAAPPRKRPTLRAQAAAFSRTFVPRIRSTKGMPRLYFELWWGDRRSGAKSFAPDFKHPVRAGLSEDLDLPLYGFQLPEEGYIIAESLGSNYRVHVPPGATVELKKGSRFESVEQREHTLSLSMGNAARFTRGPMTLVAYVAPPPEKVFVNPLFGVPYLFLAAFVLACFGFFTFLSNIPAQASLPDFTAKNLPSVAVRLIAPEPKKKEEAKKALEKIKEVAEKAQTVKKPQKAAIAKPDKPPPKEATPPPLEKVSKMLSKLTAAGPGTKDILAAVDKLGNGPGSKFSKNSDYKLSGLIGKAPIANAGLGTFGLGGGGRGGYATLGAELLHGRGAGGIGALGAGGVGRGAVGGTVTRASARNFGVQGSIDREAVAKVVNQHLQEVRGCYERALLKDPSLAGKVVLEWSISLQGIVASARTKSSTLHNGEVEGCILGYLKKWQFPQPHGGQVIVSYPFLFNSVGY